MQPANTQPTDRQTLVPDLANSAHVWFLETDRVTDSLVLERCTQVLSSDEADRYRRFRFDADRHVFLLAHVMLRQVLSRYADVDPADWQFSNTRDGRPEIAHPDPGLPLRFNLTHTRGLAACIVTQTLDCGVDAEAHIERPNVMGIAERMSAEEELRLLHNLEGPRLQDEFIKLWTLREAYCKACGTGLANSGKHFHFQHDPNDGWQIHASGVAAPLPGWRLSVERIAGSHTVAAAVHVADRPAFNVRFRKFSF
jgi:4'-phosphopantetheinyl transferase